MAETFPKIDKLKSRKSIDLLFSEGKSVAQFPLRLAFLESTLENQTKFGVSVSKRYFKNAVDRNYIKRVLREIYRKNQGVLKDGLGRPYIFMLLYQTKEVLPYAELTAKTITLFQKFRKNEESKTSSIK